MPAAGDTINFKFEFDLFGVGVDAGQTTIRAAPCLRRWGHCARRPDEQPVHGRRHLPEHHRLLGPDGHGVLPQRRRSAGRLSRRRTRSPSRSRSPGNDIDAGNSSASSTRARGTSRTTRSAGPHRAVAHQRRLGSRAARRHPAPGRLETSRTRTTRAQGPRDRLGPQPDRPSSSSARDKLLLGVVYGEGIASYMNDGGMDLAPTTARAATAAAQGGAARPASARTTTTTGTTSGRSSIGYSQTRSTTPTSRRPTRSRRASTLRQPAAHAGEN